MIITTKKKKKDEDIAPIITKETKQQAKKAIDNTYIGKIKNTWSDGYQFGDVTKTILNIHDQISPIESKATDIGAGIASGIKSGQGNFVKGTKARENISNIWDDGYQYGDIYKTKNEINKVLLGTTVDTAANFMKGEFNTAEGLVDTGRYLISDVATGYGLDNYAKNVKERAKQNTTGMIFGENDQFNNKKDDGWLKKVDEYSLFGNNMDQIVQSVGQQAFRIGLQNALGQAGLSDKAVNTVNQFEIFAGSYGSAKSEALANGADDKTATIRGIISGTSEYISENMFDSIPGFKTGEIKGISNVKNIIGEATEKTFGKTAGKLILRTFNAAGEGFEEIVSNGLETASTDIVNMFMPDYTYGMKEGQGVNQESTIGDKALKLFKDTFKSNISEESKEAFVTSFISTLITGGMTDGMTEVEKNKVIKAYAKDNNISVEAATKLFDGIAELRTQQIVDNTTGYEDRVNTKDNVTRQLTQDMIQNKDMNLQEVQEGLIARDKFTKAVGTGVVSSRGLDLNESYKAYNGDAKYKNQIANIQKFMNNRNIDARFDATMFDNNEQNAIWTTENGQESVIFNPKASADQVIQNIATHEMTHDIINQKTEAGTSLFNDVLENIKSQENYAKDRQEIEDLYAKYYDRNSEDFSAKVDEEMVANELGKNLGTQEYINRLVNEKPNLARRIYNWVVDKLDNIGKSEEYKEQKKYWKAVADKFEVAYNEQKTATGEDKTAYSLFTNENLNNYKLAVDQFSEPVNIGQIKLDNGEVMNLTSREYNSGYERIRQIIGTKENGNKAILSFTQKGTPTEEYDYKNDRVIYDYDTYVIKHLEGAERGDHSGTTLLNQLIKEAKENDIKTIIAYDTTHNLDGRPSRTFWEKQGFVDNGEGNHVLNLQIDTKSKYSLTKDSEGRTLSKEQQEYFKDSKVRDEDGNLLEVYHGTNNQFNVFDKTKIGINTNNEGLFGKGFYFTNQESLADSYSKYQKGDNNVKKGYLNLTNPFVWRNIKTEEQMNQFIKDNNIPEGTIRWNPYLQEIHTITEVENERAFSDALQKAGYDGVIYEYRQQNENSKAVQEIVAFESNQFKNIDNTTPTTNPDIRYSITKDNTGRELSEGQREYFKDSKAVDDEGNLEVMYHSGKSGDYNVIDFNRAGENTEYDNTAFGYFITNNRPFSERFRDINNEGNKGYTKEFYANITKPITHPFYAGYKYEGAELDNIVENYFKAIGEEEGLNELKSYVKEGDYDTLYDAYMNVVATDLVSPYENAEYEKEKLIKKGYDAVEFVEGLDKDVNYGVSNSNEPVSSYAVFNSNQLKNIDNLNPTSNEDIRYSMQQDIEPETQGTRTTMGELFNEIAPIREDLSNITEQMNNLSNQIETMQESLENASKGYVETYNEQRNENIPSRPLTEEDANMYQEALMNDEGYINSIEEASDNNDAIVNRITNDVQNQLGLGRKQRDTLQSIIRDAVDNDLTTEEISDALYKKFSQQEMKFSNDEAKDIKKTIRSTPIKVSDGIKTDIADYNDFKKNNFGKINFSRNGLPVDVAYAQLSELNPGLFPSNIWNPTEQLLKIADVANMANEYTETYEITPEEFDNMADFIRDSIITDRYNNQVQSDADLEKSIQFNFPNDVLPTTIRTQESIDDFIENRDIAPVREEQQQTQKAKSEARQKLDTASRRLKEMFVNRNYVIDEFAKASGNKEVKFAGDNLNNVSSETQFNVNNKQTDINGKWIGKGVTEIFAPARNEGLYEPFNDYLIQKSNIERHNVGKGSQVPLVVSQQLVAQYEQQYPQFKEWANDVYKYFDNVLQEQVDAGLITEDRYKDYRGEHGIYRSYVPFYPGEVDINRYFDNEGNIKPVSTLKRSKGNASDVNQMLAVEDSMARQTYAYKRAIRQNELYREIVKSLDKFEDMPDMDTRTEPTNLDDSLFVTPEGDKILTAYVDGERVSAKISEELYNELSQENENRIKQLEEDFSMITNPLQKISNVRRNILTSWNPTFLARNAIKDIQDAVINSKHTKDMLKNYFGVGDKSAIMELRKADTETAQQFLALYGSDNLYGDYSKTDLIDRSKMSIPEQFEADWNNIVDNKNEVATAKKLFNKFTRLNELIELAPRYAEFKASLQNGDSIQEAIYNAREVTTNFGRGGYITKALNRNGFTFLNANVQGLDKLVRNLSGENGVKGVTSVVAKGITFAMLPSILNELLYGLGDDKDEDYEALPDYIKDNYYLIKTEGNKFVRIPKGRINAAFGSLARRTINALEGDENPYEGWLNNAWDQIGVGDLGGNNILAPITQAFGSENGTAWYGGDIVPTRLQNKPAAEQTDAKIDAVSNFIGQTFNVSPYKVNYVLDQYTGGFGDILLPMITPETKSGAEHPHEYLLAPIKDTFVVNSTDDNKYAGEFYTTKDKLEIQSNSINATDEDILKYKYMSSVSRQMSELYKNKREVQADTTLSNKEKYAQVQIIQNEINNLAKEGLKNYQNITNTENYSGIGDTQFYKNNKGEWTTVNDSDDEFTAGLNPTEKTAYYNVKNKIGNINADYKAKTTNLNDDKKKKQYQLQKKEQITQAISNSGLDNYTKAMIYAKYYSNEKTMNNVVNAGYNVDTYMNALYDIDEIRNKYSKENGYSTEQRKKKTIAYINSLDMNIPQKAMLIRQYYTSFRDYNNDIVNYVNSLNITQEEKVSILEDVGMSIKGNKVTWK